MSSAQFYGSLTASALPVAELMEEANFCRLPGDWHIVVADIQNSTAAVQRGEHNQVNLVAAGCLTAGLNVARRHGIDVPFFFGGDGGTLIVPADMLGDVLMALQLHRENVEAGFGLFLHLGAMALKDVYEAGHEIRLAKAQLGKGFSKAIIIGDGLIWAEQQIKAGTPVGQAETLAGSMADMLGLECRWNRIPPPKDAQEVACYIIEAADPARQVSVYRDVLQEADRIFGSPAQRHPLSGDRMRLTLSVSKMRQEMLVKFGRWRWRHFAKEMFRTALARWLLSGKKKLGRFDGAAYLDEVIANADVLTIDGRINTIIPGTALQHSAFLQHLDAAETAGHLLYGYYSNRQSIMTCYIQSREKAHVHFVDGSDGGYTAAAVLLKQKKMVSTT